MSFDSLSFKKFTHFYLSCGICGFFWHKLFKIFSYPYHVGYFPLIPDTGNLGLISLFPISLARDLSIWLIFSKKQLPVSLIFSLVYLPSRSLISVLIFIVPFSSASLELPCSSFTSLHARKNH